MRVFSETAAFACGLLAAIMWPTKGTALDLIVDQVVEVEVVEAEEAAADDKTEQEADEADQAQKQERAEARVQEQRRVGRVQVRMAELQDNQQEQQLQNARNLLQPLLESELSFASRASAFTDEQRKDVIHAGKKLLEQLAQDYVDKQGQPNRRNRVVFGGIVQRGAIVVGGQSIDFEQEIEDSIVALLGDIVTDEQLAAFQSELEQRREFQQQVVIDALVMKLEEALYLNDEQRKKITASLAEKWDAAWAPNLMVLEQYTNYLPALPDEVVVPHLTESQKTRWNAMMKIATNSGLHMLHNRLPAIQDIRLAE